MQLEPVSYVPKEKIIVEYCLGCQWCNIGTSEAMHQMENYCCVGYVSDEIKYFESLKWTWDSYAPNEKLCVELTVCETVRCKLWGLCDQWWWIRVRSSTVFNEFLQITQLLKNFPCMLLCYIVTVLFIWSIEIILRCIVYAKLAVSANVLNVL